MRSPDEAVLSIQWWGHMATFTGTTSNETITPETVSSTVAADPPSSRPSAAADSIEGGGGSDTIDGGGGNDAISFSAPGSVARGSYGNDTIALHVPDGTVSGTADGGGGSDVVRFDLESGPAGGSYNGRIDLHGGDGKDTLSGSAGFNFNTSFQNVDVYMYGEGGNDRIEATVQDTGSNYVPYNGANNDEFLYGGAGDDTYVVQNSWTSSSRSLGRDTTPLS